MDESYYETRYRPDAGRAVVWRAIAEYLQRHIPEGATLLELGAGYCEFINQVRAARKYALDASVVSGRHCAPGVTFLHSDATRIAVADGELDCVFASNLLEHLTDPELGQLASELRRTLKPGGKLVLMQPNYYYCYREYWDDFTHRKAFSHNSLGDFLESEGFTVEASEPRFMPFSFHSKLPTSYFLTRLYLSLPWRPLAKQMLFVARRR